MPLRWFLFAILVVSHATLTWISPQVLAPVLAGVLYLPLMPLQALGLAVFAMPEAGGWSAPSLLGWALVLMLWLAIWWGMASLLARLVTKRRSPTQP
ncbi:MAG: hypothetical protein V4812_07610 [Pseudomonadota bacterium]